MENLQELTGTISSHYGQIGKKKKIDKTNSIYTEQETKENQTYGTYINHIKCILTSLVFKKWILNNNFVKRIIVTEDLHNCWIWKRS